MQGPILVIFALMWSAFVGVFDYVSARGAWKQYCSTHYKLAAGTVTDSRVTITHGRRGSVSYHPQISYKFEVDGIRVTGSRLRFNTMSTSQSQANQIVNEHPVGSTIQVYYDPECPRDSVLFPGVAGSDFLLALFLTPFNAVAVGFLLAMAGWLRERIFRPTAGGVKIITGGMRTRIRLPQFRPIVWGVATTGGLGFVSIFVLGFSTRMQPPVDVALMSILVVYLAGAAVYVWQWQKVQSGIDDLVIDEGAGTMELPLTYGRKQRMTVNIADVNALTVEQIEHRNSKGGVSYTYAPTLSFKHSEMEEQKLADWMDKRKADAFADWLRKKLGI